MDEGVGDFLLKKNSLMRLFVIFVLLWIKITYDKSKLFFIEGRFL
ncbi:hypothetical protein FEDK69T_31300 [Flavobacterium enshiense DK69]|nr:hypothetical protein FEDK69T_31300 [Flavobacterium enshiense DK69]